MTAVQDGRNAFGHLQGSVYGWLKGRPPGLIIDAGAAAGYMTLKALQFSPDSRAIAFEPFPGNWPHIEKTLGGRDNVTVVKAALSDRPGEADFYVRTTVSAEQNWHGLVGYSSVGRIVTKVTDAEKTIRVPVTTVDAHVDEPVLFMKIDVQGHELNVLKGAAATFDRGVAAASIEFNGDLDVLTFLFDRGFAVYDDSYLIVQRGDDPDLSAWEITDSGTASTGHHFFRGWPREHVSDPKAFCAMLKSSPGCAVWTDLIAIAPNT